uniref:Ig-like domain-containing protein n=1 Tax=Chelydra serpentina TaxID=8475 RepID=A0A8C3T508_CHESE
GGGVSLAPEPATQDFTSCSWYRSAITDDNSRILTYYPGPSPVQQNGPTHTGRETAGPGCALHIAGLTLSDTGNYTVRIDTLAVRCPRPPSPIHLGVSGVNITMSPSVPIEPEAVTLSCEARGSPVSYSWFKDNEILEAGSRVLLSSDNQTLTLDPSSRNDSGSYTCLATNTVSSQNATVRLDVLYGPNTPSITPRQEVYAEGSTLQLSCRADASPAAVFIWLFNGAPLASSGSDLLVPSLSVSQSGTYTCVVIILFAGRSSYTTLEIAVLGEAPENGTFTLTCNTSPSADTVLWLRDGASLVPSERLVLSPDNRTLTVLNVTRGDAGTYRCEVRNLVSTNHSEPSNVTVAYGPDSTRIDPPGPIDLTLGSPLTLTCVADSVPALSYRWVVNGTDTNETGSSLTFNPTTLDHQGTYECQAQNPITNRTAWASVTVRFPTSPTGLSPGAIAGIVIGALAGAALLGGLLYFLLRKTGG